jgi:hypothetical protein
MIQCFPFSNGGLVDDNTKGFIVGEYFIVGFLCMFNPTCNSGIITAWSKPDYGYCLLQLVVFTLFAARQPGLSTVGVLKKTGLYSVGEAG